MKKGCKPHFLGAKFVLPMSYLLCEGLGVAYLGGVLIHDHAPAFFVHWGSSRDIDSIVHPTSTLPIV